MVAVRRRGTSKVRKTKRERVHREKAPYSTDMKILIGIFILLLIVLWILLFMTGVPLVALIILVIATIIIIIVMWFFLEMKFVITDLGVFAIFGPTKYRIALDNIDYMKPLKRSKLHWYVGWGIRLWRIEGKWILAFVSQIKDSVFIRKKRGAFRNIILTTKNPADFIRRIKIRMLG